MTVAAKIDSIQKKIDELKQKKIDLERKRSEELAKLIQKCGLSDLDENILAGALLSIANQLDANKEEWQKAGQMFLGKNKKSKSQSSEKTDTKKAS